MSENASVIYVTKSSAVLPLVLVSCWHAFVIQIYHIEHVIALPCVIYFRAIVEAGITFGCTVATNIPYYHICKTKIRPPAAEQLQKNNAETTMMYVPPMYRIKS